MLSYSITQETIFAFFPFKWAKSKKLADVIYGYPMDSRHSELPRPCGWCPFSGTLWTHESTEVLWCSWVLGQGSTQGAISVKYRYEIGFDHNIGQAECHSELPRPNGWCPFSGTLWTHESTQVLWWSWVLGQGSTQGGDLREIALKDQVWSQYWASWMS